MHPMSVQRILALFLLLSLSLGFNHAVLAQPAAKGNFCIADPLPRVAIAKPERQADCPAGYASQGGSCKRELETRPAPSTAPDCPAGYKLNGASCERPALTKPNPASRPADCPDGFTNSGTACFRLSAPDPLPTSRMTCHAGETKVDTRCFKPCEAGANSAGANCVRPVSTLGVEKMSCKAGYQRDGKKNRCVAECPSGFSNTGEACVRAAESLGPEAMTCKAGETRQGGRCIAAVTACGKGEALVGGACYAACAPGFDGVGGMCWPQGPKAWLACGIGAAKDAQSCASPALDPMAMLKHHAVALGREGNATAGDKVTRLLNLHGKFREMAAAYSAVKNSPQFKRDFAAWNQANQGKDAFVALDDSGAPITEPEMMRHAGQLASIAGYAGGVASGGYPKCSTVK